MRSDMSFNSIQLGSKTINGRFVIPSGIRCTNISTIDYYFKNIDSIGIITTKSISINPKKGYDEPLYAQYSGNSYINAVGLANPGALKFKEELEKIKVPDDKFLLISIFGKNPDEYLEAAKVLEPYGDGFELNMSCPHAKGYGLQVGNDIDLVAEITKRVCENTSLPVIVKLSATVNNLAQTAKVAVQNGAAGITTTNTIGPSIEYLLDKPTLSNITGGLSGEGIRPLGLKSVYEVRQAIGSDPIIIGMGGIRSKENIISFRSAGADFFGIGSALTNLTTNEAKQYLDSLKYDLINDESTFLSAIKPVDNMAYKKCYIKENISLTGNLHKIIISEWDGCNQIYETAGKFFFIKIPEVGEKPFAVYSLKEKSFIIKNVGRFTGKLTSLKKGEEIYIRGPYGKALPQYEGYTINFVAGGTGISPIFEIAKKYYETNKIRFFIGGREYGDIFDLEEYQRFGEVCVATEDGSIGTRGYVTDVLSMYCFDNTEKQLFINCGPRKMIEKCYEIEANITGINDILVSIEYYTSCGVGICGKCSTEKGLLSCVDGPFFRIDDAMQIRECGHK